MRSDLFFIATKSRCQFANSCSTGKERRLSGSIYLPTRSSAAAMRCGAACAASEPLAANAVDGKQRFAGLRRRRSRALPRGQRRKPRLGPSFEQHLLDALGFKFRGFDLRAQLRRGVACIRILQCNGLESLPRRAQRAHDVFLPWTDFLAGRRNVVVLSKRRHGPRRETRTAEPDSHRARTDPAE